MNTSPATSRIRPTMQYVYLDNHAVRCQLLKCRKQSGEHGPLCYRTSGAAAATNSLSTGVAAVSCGLPSNMRLHHVGGSNGLCPSCRDGYTSQKKYHTYSREVSALILTLRMHWGKLTMANHNTHDFILWYTPMYHQAERHQNPWQIGRREH